MRDSGLASVDPGDKCYSACVFILAGSYRRLVGGSVGIHRPYFIGDEYLQMGYTNLQQAYDGLYEQLSALFKQWNLSRLLIDDLFVVPSSELHVLTDRELSAYGLNSDDRVLDEEWNAKVRASCGEAALREFPISEECLNKINRANRARTIDKVRRLCGDGAALDTESGRRALAESCLKKLSVTD